MKTPLILLTLLTVFSMHTFAQDFPHTVVLEKYKVSSFINSMSFSPDGQMLAASWSGAGGIYLWDTETGQLNKIFTESISSIVFSPDGQTLASVGRNGIYLWDTKIGQLNKILTELSPFTREQSL